MSRSGRKTLSRAAGILLAIVFSLGALCTGSCVRSEGGIMNKSLYGLHVEEDGTVTLCGEPFYGFGVNYFGAYARYAETDTQSTKEFTEGLAGLASYNVPFVRFPLGGYYPSYYEVYDSEPEKLFSYMKTVLDECAANRIGVIASLMWWDPAMAAHLGAKRSDMGRPSSRLVKYAKKYVEDVVSRFADHPAVWGWEIGNEYNLNADLCDKELKYFLWPDGIPGMPSLEDVNGFDYYTSGELRTFYTEIARVIRKYDGYRMITTGNGEMRPYAYSISSDSKAMDKKTHLWDLSWKADTRGQFDEMNAYLTPDPVDTVCFHLQSGSADGSNEYVLAFDVFGGSLDSEEYFKAYYVIAKKLKKACFFGEFGDMLDMETAPDVIEKFRTVTDAISASGIQIAALWQFQDYTDEGVSGEKLTVLSELNADLKELGRQNCERYWERAGG